MSSSSKRIRLTDGQRDVLRGFCRRGSISNVGLQFLLTRVKENPDLMNVSRDELLEQFHARFDLVKTSISLELNDGSWRDWSVADPGLLLSMVLRERPELANLFAVAMDAHPCSSSLPWSIIVGFDEYTPGNKTKLNNQKKCMVTSFSFLELGLENLGRGAAWMTPAIALHTSIASTKGGWSCMLKLLLKLLLVGTHGLQSVGVTFNAQGRDFVLFGRLAVLLSDGDGLREALDWKGHAGVKLCFRHWNIVNKNMDLVERDPARQYVELKCHDHTKFKCWGPGELEASIDMLVEAKRRVAAGTMTNARLQALEKAFGFNSNERGLLADVGLRSLFHTSKIATFDWMHTALQNGVITDDLYRYTKACAAVGHTHHSIETFLKQAWRCPASSRANGLHRIFNDYRSSSSEKSDHLKASASELLGVYGLVRHWAAMYVGEREDLRAQRLSFESACDIVDLILQAKRANISMPEASLRLKRAISTHMQLYIAAYGDEELKPKHHWMFDIAEQMESLPCVVDAFIIERIHLRIKRNAEKVHELRVFEKSVMAGVVNSIYDEASKPLSDGLRGATYNHHGTLVGDHLNVGSLRVDSRDVVMRGDELAVVAVCAEEDGDLYVIVIKCALVGQASRYGSVWRLTEEREIWIAAELQQVPCNLFLKFELGNF